MTAPRCLLPLLACALSSALLGAEELPPRALARLGDHHFYHGPGVTCAVLSPEGRHVASAATYPCYCKYLGDKEREAYERIIVLWEAATGERVRDLTVPHAPVSCLAFSPTANASPPAMASPLGKRGSSSSRPRRESS